jgi:hypothetical protein
MMRHGDQESTRFDQKKWVFPSTLYCFQLFLESVRHFSLQFWQNRSAAGCSHCFRSRRFFGHTPGAKPSMPIVADVESFMNHHSARPFGTLKQLNTKRTRLSPIEPRRSVNEKNAQHEELDRILLPFRCSICDIGSGARLSLRSSFLSRPAPHISTMFNDSYAMGGP